ncbi:MAG: exodeoxyribonuclease III [Hyphomicrobiales bacterium]|nr:exodeoxyribonuclease III [Hyphomicrobiales bacterium]
MLIATWNVNSVRQRAAHLLRWLKQAQPDIVCLQELKCLDDAFPRLEVEAAGYHVETLGQKTFNGVAILARKRPDEVIRGLEGDDADSHARYMEAVFSTEGGVVRVASIYLPNGNPPLSEKYPYKLGFMERLRRRAAALLRLEEPLVLAGDYNVIPEPIDARDPAAWVSDALFLPQTRAAFRRLLALGLTDALRACDQAPERYSFWDYQAGAFQKNNGIRIDHLLLSPQAADRLVTCRIDKETRSWDKPSDHVPVLVELNLT